ncbi:MAG: GGDEF domain-containing protein, partial [Betaproteobacteria bacterium]|nr:GGDEF domain-containing protein [Betaproteobacteria bacterium]
MGTKFVAFSLVLLLLIQAAVYGVVQVNVERNVRGQVKQELVIGDKVWWQLLDQNAQRLRFGAEVVAKDFGFRSALGSGDTETLRSTLENHGGRVNATVTAFLDPQFALQATGFEMAAQDKLSPVLHRVAMELGQGELTYKIELIDSKLFQFVMVPVKAPLTIGWVLMGFGLEQAEADRMFQLSGVHIALLSESRKLLLSSLPASLHPQLTELGSSADLVLGHDTLVVENSAVRAQAKGIQTYVLRSLDDVVAPYRKVQLALLLITAVGLTLFAIGSALLAQRVTVPLRSLA